MVVFVWFAGDGRVMVLFVWFVIEGTGIVEWCVCLVCW
jgi:hypothetical protein